jgi:ribosomal protein L11 methyltransferase
VEVAVAAGTEEVAAASLWAAGALGVWERSGTLVAWFAAPADLTGWPGLSPGSVTWTREPPRDWQAAWKTTIGPVRAGTTLVVPSWLADTTVAGPGDVVLVIDPGQAFGTGHHATTTLCLEALEAVDLVGRSVADVGCGTGVLGIAAARRGAAHVTAVDVDPDAVATARCNATRNGVGLDARVGSIDAVDGPADVVVANLVTDVLVALADPLVRTTRDTLVVSGIASERAERVTAALVAAGAEITAVTSRQGWVAVTATPTAHPEVG